MTFYREAFAGGPAKSGLFPPMWSNPDPDHYHCSICLLKKKISFWFNFLICLPIEAAGSMRAGIPMTVQWLAVIGQQKAYVTERWNWHSLYPTLWAFGPVGDSDKQVISTYCDKCSDRGDTGIEMGARGRPTWCRFGVSKKASWRWWTMSWALLDE